ncbi:MAG TPA: response regulator [Gemmatimonadales bacterium]|nr:response regulator [Gemmatimonadales bacterium]
MDDLSQQFGDGLNQRAGAAAGGGPGDDALEALRRSVAESVAGPAPAATGPAPPGVLMVDDDPDVTRVLSVVLAASGRALYSAGSAAEAEQVLARHPVALVVLDVLLPDADGRTVLARLRDDPRTSAVPIIVLSGHGSPETRAECYALGADAYIPKPFDPIAVAAAVTSSLARALHVATDARRDPVTGLPNRAAFREAFERTAGPRRDGASPVSVALAELDQYRTLASASGWGTADRALSLAARTLARALRRAVCTARWAGAAFAILFADADEAAATSAVSEALRAVRRAPPAEGQVGPLTFSAGVAEWTASGALEETLAEAESQLVSARSDGGDAVRSSIEPGPAAPRLVLLAEDDELIVSVVKHRLEREGIAVRHFADGLAASRAAAQLRPSLAILDVKMPGMDGFELLGRLRAEPALHAMPVMMLISMGREQDVVRGLELGADDYIVKPFSPVELVARVHRHLLRR